AELETEWKKYPVLHFDMSSMRNCSSMEGYREALSDELSKYEKQYGIVTEAKEPGTRFRQLLRHIHDTLHMQSVVIIDEYDTPLMRNLYNKELLEELRSLLRGFYQTVKLDGAYLRFVFITGVTKFSQVSIFSELNNLMQISMEDEYSGICGITQKELDTVLRPCVEEYAEALKITTEEAYALLKKNYDGYHFSPNSEDVYAPFSLLRALNGKNTNHYWFESGTMTALIEHLKHYPIINALQFDGVELGGEDFNMGCEDATTPIPLLYQSGYLTIDTYDPLLRSYTLHYPNLEVREGMIRGLMPLVLNRTNIESNNMLRQIARGIYEGDLSKSLVALRAYIAKIPYDIITRKDWDESESREGFYKMLFYMVFSLLNSIVDTEVKSILGRADVVIQTKTHVFVLELKVDDSVENALAQIDDKGYAIPYSADGREVIKCGVSISSDARNIIHWRITNATSAILNEEKF
ncbi:MAG: AAA family ATPase, partial [Bacteroidales bacterium]|nr:AAA family ATPase [Bacteroidales bacterium]